MKRVDFYYTALPGQHWISQPQTPLPTGSLETPLGTMEITCYEGLRAQGVLSGVKINGVLYSIWMDVRLDTHSEEWREGIRMGRVRRKPNGELGHLDGEATPAAKAYAESKLSGLLGDWAGENFGKLENARRVTIQRMLEQAEYWYASALQELLQRRRWLDQARADFERDGRLDYQTYDHLRNIYNWRIG